MASPRPNRKRSAKSSHQTDKRRPAGGARSRPESPRSILVLALVIGIAATVTDWADCAFTVGSLHQSGHLHIDVGMTLLGLALTVLAVYAFRGWWKALRAAPRQRGLRRGPTGERSSKL